MKFRTDINGLRAYAVLAVIIFHFNKQWLSGGFAGVDVFFVISGYLMTSIIFRGLENNSFSIWKFYVARIKRIVPALLVLVVVLMIFGYLFLGPIPYANLAKHSGGSLLFISNIMYWKESGYFDASTIEKYLLHTWSLSVEWQFYIIYPFVLLISSKIIKIETLKKLIVVGTVLSLIFAIYVSQRWTVASYFLLPTRMWEMLLGGVAFLYPLNLKNQAKKHVLELSGLALIVASFFIVNENTLWPGYMALIPTLGAFILIQANNDKSIFTNNIICQKLGLWSYSLYLWHWSLLAVYNYFGYKIKILPFLFVTFVCGITSYYAIEKRKWNVWLIISSLFITITLLFGVYKTDGVFLRDENNLKLSLFSSMVGHNDVNLFFDPKNHNVLLNQDYSSNSIVIIGDSHALHYTYGITASKNKTKTEIIWHSGCLNTATHFNNRPDTDEWKTLCKNNILNSSINTSSPVIISQAWHRYTSPEVFKQMICINDSCKKQHNNIYELLDDDLTAFKNKIKDRSLVIIGGLPVPKNPQYSCYQKLFRYPACQETYTEISPEALSMNNFLKKFSEDNDILYIDLSKYLCNEDGLCIYAIDGYSIYYDVDHLSIIGSKYIWKKIEKTLSENHLI